MRILITGGAGSLGMNLVPYLINKNYEILVLDNFLTGNKEIKSIKKPNLSFIEIDLNETDELLSVFTNFNPNYVIHLSVSYDDPENWVRDINTNILSLSNIINYSEKLKVKQFINIQTILCYEQISGIIKENGKINPLTSYSISKTTAEQYLAISKLNYVSLRLSSVYGPWSFTGPIPTFFKKISKCEDCLVTDAYRDYIYISDFLKLIDKIIDNKKIFGIYNVSNDEPVSIKSICENMIELMKPNKKINIIQKSILNDDVKKIFLDSSKIKELLSWKPEVKLKDGLRLTIDWYNKHGVTKTFTHLRQH